MTARYSSLWDRLRGDNSTYSQDDWEAWLAIDHPAAIERDASGGYVDPHDNPRSWQICPHTFGQIVWLYLRGIVTGAQAKGYFSCSDHEALQVGDMLAWLTAAGNLQNQILRYNDMLCLMDQVEQRGMTSKAWLYSTMSIRADSASG